MWCAGRCVGRDPAALRILLADLLPVLGRPWAVGHRDAVVRRSLEYHQLLGLPGDDRNRLNTRRTRAGQANTLAPQIGILAWPRGGGIHLACETVAATDTGAVPRGQAARRAQQKLGGVRLASRGADT